MNWANRLTLGRLVLTVLFVFALSSNWAYGRTAALALFLLASVTDYLDGEIARRYGIVTKFGKLMDPLVDKVMMAAAFICLVPIGAIPAWVATIVVARDFLITGLRLLAATEGIVLPAETLGKHKTSWQIATVIYFPRAPHRDRSAHHNRRSDLVADGLALRRRRAPLDHDWPDDLFRARLSLAAPRFTPHGKDLNELRHDREGEIVSIAAAVAGLEVVPAHTEDGSIGQVGKGAADRVLRRCC